MRLRIAAVAALTLVVGFGVASVTGNRALGGVVLVAGGALCAWWLAREAGLLRTSLTLVGVVVLFVVSHPLGRVIGAWPAVLLVAAAAAALAYALASPRETSSPVV
jgi:ABC-type siderophore export system fused ATPase/permease subunit